MRSRVLSILALVAALVGMAASIASLVDLLGPAPTFCAETGCATVRASAWGHPLGIPMPVLGVAFFAAMIALCFVARPRLRLVLAIAGGAWALALIGVQAFAIGVWCKLCMIADPAALALALAVAAGGAIVRPRWWRVALVAPAIAASVLALAAWAHPAAPELPPGTPDVVARAQQPGKVTVVEFVDFECPFCRELAPKLHAAIAAAAPPVQVVRKMVPLPMHPHAMPAAVAWCCADAQGKGDAMADALFAADPETLTPDGCERLAARVGCDLDRYERDLPVAVGRVAADLLDARAAQIHNLPTVFIGGERVVGAAASTRDLVAAIDRTAR